MVLSAVSNINFIDRTSVKLDKCRTSSPYLQSTLNDNFKKPSLENLKAYYAPSFGRLRLDHLQNGAFVDEAKNVFFKLFTFPNVKQVSVVIAKEIEDTTKAAKKTFQIITHELQKDLSEEAGVFKLQLGPNDVKPGDKYAFEIINSNGQKTLCCDPYAKRKTAFFIDPGKSKDGYLNAEKLYRTDKFAEIYDHNAFKWTDNSWILGNDKRRISRLSGENGLKSTKEARILEINIPTFTKDGTFDAAKAKINKMIEKGWFKANGKGAYNTIELMPVETSYAPGWNYDGVYKNAPLEPLGGPDGLKRLVDYAHSKGINMVMDSVPNHFGTDNNFLREVGPYMGKSGAFGDKPNLENDFRDNKHVRDWVINMCGLNWLRDYHFDGLRLDLTHDMDSDYTLRQLVNEINHHERHAFITLEDDRVRETERLLSKLSNEEIALNEPESVHANIIKKYDNNQVPLNIGVDSRWSYEWEHAINKACSGNIPMSTLKDEMVSAVKRGDLLYGARQSHDEKGNADGISEITALVRDRLNMFAKVEGSSDCKKGQNAAQATQALLESLVTGKHPDLSRNSYLANVYKEADEALNYAIAQNKISIGLTATLPGPKMRFQGTMEPFYFFRKFSSNAEADWAARKLEKGYAIDGNAIKASTIDSIPYTKQYRELFEKADKFERDINEFATSNKAMNSGYIYEDSTIAHDHSKVLGTHLKKDDSEVFTVSNFSGYTYNGGYQIKLPKGKWREVINSNDTKYAGNGKALNTKEIISNGTEISSISLPSNSLVIFEKVND